MSSILKALRKLEEEKAAMGEGRVDLARDILKRSSLQGKPDNSLIVKSIFFVVLALTIVAGLWLLLAPDEQSAKMVVVVPVVAEPAVPAHVPVVSAPVQYQIAQPVQKPISAPAPEPVKQVIAVPKPVEVSLPAPEVVSYRQVPATVPAEVEEVVVVTEPVSQPELLPVATAAPEKGSQPLPVSISQQNVESANMQAIPNGLPPLSIDAIMYKPNPGDRLAVINDFPVMEGTSIDGVQIVEILKQGVRFSWQGMEFILPLEAGSPQ